MHSCGYIVYTCIYIYIYILYANMHMIVCAMCDAEIEMLAHEQTTVLGVTKPHYREGRRIEVEAQPCHRKP
jgi:hypothetical protein